ncbi:hypothetical protein OsJ_13050 [Oryza sativa Japonica Group]|uniref:galactinol--sucrose galactosyltransferase n=1 Tax=Oryza sativa subsp. japonica TaxID=39947 RepID=B9F6W2_ORYSJ|nr:hypothetical protein OsJ_13050 [Oryza sativa Japonica Group]
MTVTPRITVAEGRLVAHGRTILTGVADNIALTHASGAGLVDGAFVGATADEPKSLHVFTFGTLRDLRFMCCFRFKLWWMTQRMGTSGRDVPLETQFMLLESRDGGGGGEAVYVVMLPLLEGQFRAALQGNDRDELEICIESGWWRGICRRSTTGRRKSCRRSWTGSGGAHGTPSTPTSPPMASSKASKAWRKAARRRGFLIIDDGWQQIGSENKEDAGNAVVQEGAQFASRLIGIKENTKFQKTTTTAMADGGETAASAAGLKALVEEAKKEHGVKYVYVWHAMAGYWGGVKPAAEGMEHYESAVAFPVQSPGVMGNQPDIVMDSLSVLGLGLVHPRMALAFYGELHAYLASCGVDGVKVDAQNIIETLGAGHGGRVSLTRAFHRALEASVARSFPDNGCISCMCHNTDMLYSARQTAVVRASDDFYPLDPASHTIHISSVAYNTLFLGEFMQPDWDMFHSLHPAAEYHGAARAIGGCPIYVSDKPGNHNFELLKKLVLPDGSVLRARLPGRPTRDCLFVDPARDGASLLKIWNVNKCTGVVGVFNCQGAGWCRITKKTRVHDAAPGTLTGSVRADDVDAIADVAGTGWTGDAVVYAHRSGELIRLPKGATLPVTAQGAGVRAVPCEAEAEAEAAVVRLRARGCGRFGAYSSRRPARCALDAVEVEFSYDADTGLVALDVPVPAHELYKWTVEIQV